MTIKITVFNRMGGVGKTTLAIILTQIALMKNKNVLAVDLDEQKNFSADMSYLQHEPRFQDKFTLKNSIEHIEHEYYFSSVDWIIIDCPPCFNEHTRLAIRESDFVIVPVRPDLFSISGFSTVRGEARNYKELFQFPIVKIGFNGSVMTKKVDEKIAEFTSMGYVV